MRDCTSVIVSASIIAICAATCLFDDIQPQNPIKSVLNYPQETTFRNSKHSLSSSSTRIKRDISKRSELYQPIRINPKFYGLDEELNPEHEEKLKRIVHQAIAKASRLFSVVPVEGNLFLSRSLDACQVIWRRNSTNSGKCAQKHPGYFGETCLDQFTIPEDHLEGFYVYPDSSPTPHEAIPPGNGLPDTDFVLYVRSLTSSECINGGLDIIAYAAYCQTDQYYRPIAGYINFCPLLISRQDYDEERIYLTALHELFHALGFSAELFTHFQDCVSNGPNDVLCSNKPNSVRSVLNAKRLVAPKVVETTSQHYNCRTHPTINEFGPILQTNSDGRVRSHWDAAFLQGSIMMPTIGLPHLTILDPITLAFFEDTGWYKVDFKQAEKYKWGKDEGCDFGLYPQCLDDHHCFCKNLDRSGCHFLRKDKGKCITDSFLHDCLLFKPVENCESPSKPLDNGLVELHGEYYGKGSRCFESNITKETSAAEIEGRCYQQACLNGTLKIKVGDEPWCFCPRGETITVPGYQGVLECPEEKCMVEEDEEQEPTPYPEAEPTSTTKKQPSEAKTTTEASVLRPKVCLELVFASADYNALERSTLLQAFEAACREEILTHGMLAMERITNTLLYDGSVHFQFDLLEQEGLYGPPSVQVIAILEETVAAGNFTFSVQDMLFVASDIQEVEDAPYISNPDNHTGIIIGVTIASIVVIVLIIGGIFLGKRFFLIRSRLSAHNRPQPRRERRHGTVNNSHLQGRTGGGYTNSGYGGDGHRRQQQQQQQEGAHDRNQMYHQQRRNGAQNQARLRRTSEEFIRGHQSNAVIRVTSISEGQPHQQHDNNRELRTSTNSTAGSSVFTVPHNSTHHPPNRYLPPVHSLSQSSLDDPSRTSKGIGIPPLHNNKHSSDARPPGHKLSSASLNSQIPMHRLSTCSAPFSQGSGTVISMRDLDISQRTSFSSDSSGLSML